MAVLLQALDTKWEKSNAQLDLLTKNVKDITEALHDVEDEEEDGLSISTKGTGRTTLNKSVRSRLSKASRKLCKLQKPASPPPVIEVLRPPKEPDPPVTRSRTPSSSQIVTQTDGNRINTSTPSAKKQKKRAGDIL